MTHSFMRCYFFVHVVLLWFSGTYFGTAGPKNPDSDSLPSLTVAANPEGLSIKWKGKNRLFGGLPFTSSTTTWQSQTVQGKTENFTFRNSKHTTPFLVRTAIHPTKDGLVCYLTKPIISRQQDPLGFHFSQFPNYKQGIASYLFGDWESWTKPIKIIDIRKSQNEKILFFLFQFDDGTFGAMIPLGGNGYNATLGSTGSGFGATSTTLIQKNNDKEIPLFALAFGSDPFDTTTRLFEIGMEAMDKPEGLRKQKVFPEPFEFIGWCSWNAMKENVSEKRLMAAIKTFSDHGFRIPFMLIDDGWLSIDKKKRLTSFEFDPIKFPNGFKSSAQKLKETYGIEHIGVWHTLNGYWNGLDPNGFPEMANNLIAYRDKANVHHTNLSEDLFYSPSPLKNKGAQFYNTWYLYLKEQGISFVKVDQQSSIKRIAKGQLTNSDKLPYWQVAENMESHLQNAVKKHFNGAIINCQNMASEAFFNYGSSAVARNSDDFFPERTAYFSLDEEKGNAAAHVLVNLHNSFWFSNLVWPDFDMFQSHHIDAEFHAISRAISGGPIYITDSPGQQDFNILKQLTFSDGKILRTDIPVRPTQDCLFQINDNKPFKAFSFVGKNGVLGIWNTDDSDLVRGTFSPADLYGIQGEEFAVYDYFAKKAFVRTKNKKTKVELTRKGYQLYHIVPLEKQIAVFGLTQKYIATKGIIKQQIGQDGIIVHLKEGGEFSAWLPIPPKSIRINDQSVDHKLWTYKNNLFRLMIPNSTETPILKITLRE